MGPLVAASRLPVIAAAGRLTGLVDIGVAHVVEVKVTGHEVAIAGKAVGIKMVLA